MAHEFREDRVVEFAETDMAGIVHFSNFFRYMERAEHAFFRSLGIEVHRADGPDGAGQRGWARVQAACDYLEPLRYPETFGVHLVVRAVGRTSLTYDVTFTTAAGATAARGRLKVVCVERDPGGDGFRAVPVPPEVAERIEAAPPSPSEEA